MKRIYLVRHGRSLAQDDETHYARYGDINVPLSELGGHQASYCADFLKDHFNNNAVGATKPLCIRTSPFERAMQTLRPIYQAAVKDLGIAHDVNQDRHLCEQTYGYLPALDILGDIVKDEPVDNLETFKRIVSKLSRHTHEANPYIALPFGGESPKIQSAATDTFIRTLKEQLQYAHDDALIVSHGATMKNMFIEWFNLMPQAWKELETPSNCDVYVISGDGQSWSVEKIYDGVSSQDCSVNPLHTVTRFNMS